MMSLFGKSMLDRFAEKNPEYTALAIGDTIGKTRENRK